MVARSILVLLLSLLCSPCWGQTTAVAELQARNVCKIRVPAQTGYNFGSGTYLGDGLVLSCKHLWWGRGGLPCEVGKTRARCIFEFLQGENILGTVVAVDREWDMSLIRLDSLPGRLPGVPLAKHNPKLGDSVTFFGYPSAGDMRVMGPGRVVRFVSHTGFNAPPDWFVASVQVYDGYSGGAAINQRGELVGNLWGADNGTTTSVSAGRTQRFLRKWAGRLRQWRGQCPGGICAPPQWQYQPPGNAQPPTGGGNDGLGRQPTPTPDDIIGPDLTPPENSAPPQVATAPKLEVGETITVEPGESARVELRLEGDSYVLDFYIPRGDDGAEGPQGLPGKDGSGVEIDANAIALLIQQQLDGAIDSKIDDKLAGMGHTFRVPQVNAAGTVLLDKSGKPIIKSEFIPIAPDGDERGFLNLIKPSK